MYKFCSKCGNKLTLNTKTFDSECNRCGMVFANPDADELRAQYYIDHPEELNKVEEVKEEVIEEAVQEEVNEELVPEEVVEEQVFIDNAALIAKNQELKNNPEELKEELLDYIHDRDNNLTDVLAFYNFFEKIFANYQRFSDAELLNIMFEVYEFLPTNLVDKYREGYTNFKVKVDSIDKVDSNNTLIEGITKAKENFLDYYASLDLTTFNKKSHNKIKELKERALKDIDFLSDLEHFNEDYNLIKNQFIENISQFKIVEKNKKKQKNVKPVKEEKQEPKQKKKSKLGLVFVLVLLFLLVAGGVVIAGFIPTVQYETISTKYTYEQNIWNEDTNKYEQETKTVRVKGVMATGIKGLFWDSYFAVKDITIKDSTKDGTVVLIAANAFKGLELESVTLPSSLKMIGKNAFEDNNLKEITIPNSVGFVDNKAFSDNKSLTNVNFNGNAELVLNDKVFSGCKNLKTFNNKEELPMGITHIGSNTFEKTKVKNLYINNTIQHLELDSFPVDTTVTVDVEESYFRYICPITYYEQPQYTVLYGRVRVMLGYNQNLESVNNGYYYSMSLRDGYTLEQEILDQYKPKPHYSFKGLYSFDELAFDENGVYQNVPIQDGVTLIARYEPIEYEITYSLEGGEMNITSEKYNVTKLFSLPTPTKENYVFKGWLLDGQYVTEYSELTGNVTLVADWFYGYKVNFYYYTDIYGLKLIDSIYVSHGSSIDTFPVAPVEHFLEWRDRTTDDVVDSNTIITKNMDVYAAEYEVCKVYFFVNDMLYHSEEVRKGTKISSLPVCDDPNFKGWYISYISGLEFTTDVIVNTDIYVYANISITISYMSLGSLYEEKTYSTGDTINPVIPTRSSYIFAGWFTDSSCYNAFEFEGTLDDSITLYAKWISAPSYFVGAYYSDNIYYYYANSNGSFNSSYKIAYIPLCDGTLNVYSSSGSDTCGYLYDSNGNRLTSNDDYNSSYDFKYSYNVTAGNVYYIAAKFYSNNTGYFNIYIDGPSTSLIAG